MPITVSLVLIWFISNQMGLYDKKFKNNMIQVKGFN